MKTMTMLAAEAFQELNNCIAELIEIGQQEKAAALSRRVASISRRYSERSTRLLALNSHAMECISEERPENFSTREPVSS